MTEDLYERLKEAKDNSAFFYTLTPAEIFEIVNVYETLYQINDYIQKMGYCEIIDNPRESLTKILKKENNDGSITRT